MPTDPAYPAPPQLPGTDMTALFGVRTRGAAEGGYGARYAEDSFDYPSPGAAESWSDGQQPLDAAPDAAPSTGVDEAEGVRRADQGHARETGWWERVAGWRRSTLVAVAALLVMGGFGLSLSMVGSTVSSDPSPGAPGGTSQVTVPQSPTAPALPPQASGSASPPAGGAGGGATALPTQPTGTVPGAGGLGDNQGGQDRQEDHGREDGDHADDS